MPSDARARPEDGKWLKMADEMAKSAERARLAGDTVASLAMAACAAQCLRVHRNLTEADRILSDRDAAEGVGRG